MLIRRLRVALLTSLPLCFAAGAAGAPQTPGGPASGLERPLTAVSYPEDETIRLSLASSPHLASAVGEAKIRRRRGVTEIDLELKQMQPAMLFGGDINTYVLWTVTPEGRADNAGEIITQGSNARLTATTPLAAFGVMVTAEPHFLARKPSRFVILTSTDAGLLQQKGAAPVPVTYSDFVTSYNARQENLPGLAEARGEARTDRHQALIAVRSAEEAGAQEWAREVFEQARAALSETQKTFAGGAADKDLTIVAHRAVRLAVRAKELAEQRRAAALLADERKVNHETIEKLRADLAEASALAARSSEDAKTWRARAEELSARLTEAEQSILKANQEADRLARDRASAQRAAEAARNQAAGFSVRMQNALRQLADIESGSRGLTVFLPDVLFTSGSSKLLPGAREVLSRIAGVLLVAPEYRLSIEGHTDSTGSPAVNRKLSAARADAVRKYLEDCGISIAMMSARGFGETQPIASNNTAAGRQQNRRVELVIEGLMP